MSVKLLVPSMPSAEELLPYIRKIDESRQYSNNGALVQELERRLATHYGGAHVIAVANCTVGLEIVWMLEKSRGQKIATMPALTFPASATAALRAGMKLRFTDVDPHTFTAPGVSGFGYPQTGRILDAAGAFGEQEVRRGTTAVFSLHATKPLGCGEGGYIVTWVDKDAAAYRQMMNFGLKDGVPVGPGTNAKMSEYHAAVALAALDRWDRRPWERLYDYYAEHLPSGCVPQKRPRGVYSLMPVKLTVSAQRVMGLLKHHGIDSKRYYCPPLTTCPLYPGPHAPMPVTDHLAEHLLCLPYHVSLTERDVRTVCQQLAAAVDFASEPSDAPLRVRKVFATANDTSADFRVFLEDHAIEPGSLIEEKSDTGVHGGFQRG